MSIASKIRRALRGEIARKTVALELLRRGFSSFQRGRDRAIIEREVHQPAIFHSKFGHLEPAELLGHFQNRSEPRFLPGFSEPLSNIAKLHQDLFPEATKELVNAANRTVDDHCWPLLGLGDRCFGPQIDWNRDLLSGKNWPLDYHAQLNLIRNDGSDVRVLWELNRLSQTVNLACAYAVTSDERFSAEFFRQVESWQVSNPLGRGPNWNCAMEVALRAMNLLGAFEVFRRSSNLNTETLARLLAVFDQHGRFIRRNLEYSYITTSNHYLSDVTGLLWLGIMLPELSQADSWREFGLREMLREMDKQVLPDGADFESSTGYHRFVLELFLYSFVLCRANGIEIADRYWTRLHRMLEYSGAYLRPDGRAPTIGDSDSGQVFPTLRRSGDDHAYVLAIGASMFEDSQLKLANQTMPQELLWITGEQGVSAYQELAATESGASQQFPDAGVCILRDRDLYLLLNAGGIGINGRGSHGHNDALSIEVSACGRAFIVDPGSYVYTADLKERHRFRSTAYHSTVEIDGVEQNITNAETPFVIGDEAHPRVLLWETGPESDKVSAEHYGYRRLAGPVVHRRTVTFNKRERWWLVEDELSGAGEHDLSFRFHFDSDLDITVIDDRTVSAYDKMIGAKVYIRALDVQTRLGLEDQFTSRDYGSKTPSRSAIWSVKTSVPFRLRWTIVPVCAGEGEGELRSDFRLLSLNPLGCNPAR